MAKKGKYTDPFGYCLVCGFMGVDIHHIQSRGASGKPIDEDWNLVKLCHPHHQELHQIGDKEFAENNYEYELFLLSHGWELCPIRNKWFKPKVEND